MLEGVSFEILEGFFSFSFVMVNSCLIFLGVIHSQPPFVVCLPRHKFIILFI